MLLYFAIFGSAIVSLLYFVDCYVRNSRKGKLIDKIPGPYAWPIFGNVFQFLGSLEKLWIMSRWLRKTYYPVNRIWSSIIPIVHIYHPDDIEILLSSTKHIEKSIAYKFLRPWLGTGLLTSTGPKWNKRRKILTPAFHFKVLEQFVGIFVEQSEKLAESLCLEGEEVVPDLVSLLHKYTLNTICDKFPETTMGYSSEVDNNVLREYRTCVSEMGDLVPYRLIRPWLYPDWIFRYFKKFKEQVRLLEVLHGFSKKIINNRKRYHEETDGRHLEGLDSNTSSSIYSVDQKNDQGKRRLAMLDLLILAQKRNASIDDEGIREEVDTFIFEVGFLALVHSGAPSTAEFLKFIFMLCRQTYMMNMLMIQIQYSQGHDTAAMALCFALLLLAENEEIQNKARAEVDEVFGRKGIGELSLRDLRSLGYLERCIKEALRLFPSVPFISRILNEDLQLKNHLIPGGTFIAVNLYEVHRDPHFWPDPEEFNPDRFLPDQVQGRHPFAYVPFSAGPRNCIGQKFAILKLNALVATFLRNFYLKAIDFSSEVQFAADIVLRPRKPIRVKLVRRSPDDIQQFS